MSSAVAMKRHAGGVAEYRASEGKAVEVPYRGPVEATVLEVLGGLRSACTYVGAGKLKELSKRTTFIRVSAQLNEVFRSYETKQEHGYTRLTAPKASSSSSAAGGDEAGAGAGSSSVASTPQADSVLRYTEEGIGIGGPSAATGSS